MNWPGHFDDTVDYYNLHASAYINDTINVDLSDIYDAFLGHLSPGAHILDAGCGSGRDSLAFKRLGYLVTAIDASTELAKKASEVIGEKVEVARFQDLAAEMAFDGIWACASLLHVPDNEIDDVVYRFARALKPAGTWYMSFKTGDRQEVRHGRLFRDYNEQTFRALVGRHSILEIVRIWANPDRRPGRAAESWLNTLVRKGPA